MSVVARLATKEPLKVKGETHETLDNPRRNTPRLVTRPRRRRRLAVAVTFPPTLHGPARAPRDATRRVDSTDAPANPPRGDPRRVPRDRRRREHSRWDCAKRRLRGGGRKHDRLRRGRGDASRAVRGDAGRGPRRQDPRSGRPRRAGASAPLEPPRRSRRDVRRGRRRRRRRRRRPGRANRRVRRQRRALARRRHLSRTPPTRPGRRHAQDTRRVRRALAHPGARLRGFE